MFEKKQESNKKCDLLEVIQEEEGQNGEDEWLNPLEKVDIPLGESYDLLVYRGDHYC